MLHLKLWMVEGTEYISMATRVCTRDSGAARYRLATGS